MTVFPCRPFIDYSSTVQYVNYQGFLWSIIWDGNMLVVTYPNQKVDEFLNVSRGTAQQIFQSENPYATFLSIQSSLIPVLMFTENYINGAWQTSAGDYITTKGP